MYKAPGLLPTPLMYQPIQLFPHQGGYNSPGQSQQYVSSAPTPAPVRLLPPNVLKTKFPIPDDVISELIIRFVMNIPEEERLDAVRLCFQIELAHWFFVDHYCGEDKDSFWQGMRGIPFPDFAYLMFQKIHFLRDEVKNIEKIIQEFREYKMKVPTFGAILMDQDLKKVVLVQGFRGHWGFPKGKINKDEAPAACAAREVLEETGYDCAPLLDENNWVESCVMERWTRLYFIRGVDPNVDFKPHTRYEIKNIGWFNIKDLPESKTDTSVVAPPGFPHSAFHTVFPFVKRLKRWVDDKRSGKNELSFFRSNAANRPDHILDRTLDGGNSGRRRKTSENRSVAETSKFKKPVNKTPGKAKPSSTSQTQKPAAVKVEVAQDNEQYFQHPFQFQSPFATPPQKSQVTKKAEGKTEDNKAELSHIGQTLESMLKNSIKGFQLQNREEPQNPFMTGYPKLNPKRRLFASDDEKEDALLAAKLGGLSVSTKSASYPSATPSREPMSAFSTISSPSWTNFKLDTDQIICAMKS